jgi:hypothetical protein
MLWRIYLGGIASVASIIAVLFFIEFLIKKYGYLDVDELTVIKKGRNFIILIVLFSSVLYFLNSGITTVIPKNSIDRSYINSSIEQKNSDVKNKLQEDSDEKK